MSNSFCRFLSNGLSITRNSADKFIVRPCCWHQSNVELGTIDNYKSEFNQIQDWTPGCVTCQRQEISGLKSFRQASFDIVNDVPHDKPIELDLSVDNNCNAACVMCGTGSSSTWHKQYTKNLIPIENINYSVNDRVIKLIDNIDYSEVKRIRFFGGEPLLGNTHLIALEKIPDPSKVTVWYTTNASIHVNDDILRMWEKFDMIYIALSIDAIGKQFDYIRWPLTWDKIANNVELMKSAVPNNVLFRINHTLNPFNIYYYDRLENWINEHFQTNKCGDLVEINMHPAWGNWSLAKTPEKLRQKIYKKYGDVPLSNLLKVMPQESPASIKQFIDQWEPIRKNNWKNIFPEIVTDFDF